MMSVPGMAAPVWLSVMPKSALDRIGSALAASELLAVVGSDVAEVRLLAVISCPAAVPLTATVEVTTSAAAEAMGLALVQVRT
jgi:hypothetical protein